MKNYLFEIMYDGSAYHGWQVQENAVTVQEKIQDAVERIFGVRYGVTGCSRTDSGVHANSFCFNMRTPAELDCAKTVRSLNAVLPYDISVLSCREVSADFHARYDCISKQYVYLIWNTPTRNPFYVNRAFHYPFGLDINMLGGEAEAFLGTHDFSAFCASGSSVEDKIRTVKSIELKKSGDLVKLYIEADGFLYNMVRIITGTLLDINSGKIQKGKIPFIIETGDRNLAGKTAPACGLYLNKVNYNI